MRFRLVVDESNWPLLTGGHCSEVAVKAGLTVYLKNALFYDTFFCRADVDENVTTAADGGDEKRHDLFRRQDVFHFDVASDAPRVRVDGQRVFPFVVDQDTG